MATLVASALNLLSARPITPTGCHRAKRRSASCRACIFICSRCNFPDSHDGGKLDRCTCCICMHVDRKCTVTTEILLNDGRHAPNISNATVAENKVPQHLHCSYKSLRIRPSTALSTPQSMGGPVPVSTNPGHSSHAIVKESFPSLP